MARSPSAYAVSRAFSPVSIVVPVERTTVPVFLVYYLLFVGCPSVQFAAFDQVSYILSLAIREGYFPVVHPCVVKDKRSLVGPNPGWVVR